MENHIQVSACQRQKSTFQYIIAEKVTFSAPQAKKSTFLVSNKSQNALNRVLIADSESTQKIMQTGTGIIDFDAFCVELRPFYQKKRISAPMYGIAFWGIMAGLVPTRQTWRSTQVYFGIVIGFTFYLPYKSLRSTLGPPRSTSGRPQVDLVGTGLCPYT